MYRITIVQSPPPASDNLNDKLQWFGGSLGLFGLRDKDKSQFRIFIALLKRSRLGSPISSDELAEELHLSRGTVIHHINKLIEAGIVVAHENRYFLRVAELSQLVLEMKRDLEESMESLQEVAGEIDALLKS
jgi:predicted transcriptional regulator